MKEKYERISKFFFPNKIYASTPEPYSWNFLMDAVDKVEEDGLEVCIIDKECEISTMGYKNVIIISHVGESKKKAVFEALNKYVIWYLTERKVWIEEGII